MLSTVDDEGARSDGFLKASDVAQLKLNADLIVLSACNTSAGIRNDQDAMSGLVKAFILAGSRSVVATLWSVETESATELIVTAVEEQRKDKALRVADAMRLARMKLLAGAVGERVHPFYWAPFASFGAN